MKKKEGKVLIVEDEGPMRQVLSEEFARTGFSVLEAKDGKQGFTLALKERPDMIVLDIMLPHTNGMTMMRKLRTENKWGKKVPILLLTNLTTDEKIIREIAENEPAYYLVKSDWKLDDIVQKVQNCIEDQRVVNES